MKHSRMRLLLFGAALVVGLAGCSPIPPAPPKSPLPSPAATSAEVAAPVAANDSPLATAMPSATPDPKQTPLVITGVEIGPDGHEILRIKNITGDVIALTGYSLLNPSTGRRFNFPPDLTLAAGETVAVHSGVSQAAVKDGLFWQAEPVWAGLGEDALLLSPTSALAYWYVYQK